MKKEKILLVDALNLLFRCFCASPITDEVGNHIGLLHSSLDSLRKTISDTSPDRVFVIWDGRGGSKKRRKIYENYKAGRKVGKMYTVHKFETSESQIKSLNYQIGRFKKYLEFLPISEIVCEGLEADDVIAYICNKMIDRDKQEIIISSTDKDFIQLIDESVTIFNPMKNIHLDKEKAMELYTEGVTPQNFVLVRCVEGDKSDNIPGIKGVGIKSMVKLFPELKEEIILSVNDIIDEAKMGSSKNCKKIAENKDIMDLNFKLMTLGDGGIEISIESIIIIKSVFDKSSKLFESGTFIHYLNEDKMYKHLKYINNFQYIFSRLHGKSMKRNKRLGEDK